MLYTVHSDPTVSGPTFGLNDGTATAAPYQLTYRLTTLGFELAMRMQQHGTTAQVAKQSNRIARLAVSVGAVLAVTSTITMLDQVGWGWWSADASAAQQEQSSQ